MLPESTFLGTDTMAWPSPGPPLGLCANAMLPQIDAFLGMSHGPEEARLVGIR